MSRTEAHRESRKLDGLYVGQNLNRDGEALPNAIEAGIDAAEGESRLTLILNGSIKKTSLIISKIGLKVANSAFN